MMRKSLFIGLFCTTLISASPSFSALTDDEGLDDLLSMDLENLANVEVSVASKKSEKISEAPGIVNVLSADEIRASGAQNLLDALSRMPGVFGNYSLTLSEQSLEIRGDATVNGNIHSLILINGRPVRESTTGANDSIMLGSYPLSIIDRVEVIRGPGSVLYGTNAYAGVINVITKTQDQEGASGELAYTHGSFHTNKSEGYFALKQGEFQLSGAARKFDTAGYEISGNDITGRAGSDHKSSKELTFTANATYGGLSINALSGQINERHFQIPATFPFPKFWNKEHFVDVGYEHDLSDTWKANINGSYTNFKQRYGTGVVTNSDGWLGELSFNGAVTDNINLLFGGTYQFIQGHDDIIQYDFSTRRSGAYAQVDYKPIEPLKLIAGVQLNKPANVDRNFSPRFGAIYQIDENWGTKVLYGKAFRSAYPTEQYLNIPGFIVGDPSLSPEEVETWDGQVFYQDQNYYGALTLFKSTHKGTISTSGINFVNGGEVRASGGTLEGRATLDDDWQFSASATYQDNENISTGNDAFATPHWNVKGGVTWRGLDGVTIDVFDQYFSPADTHNLNVQVNPDPDSYHLLTANVEVELHEFIEPLPQGLNLSISGFNLLDETIKNTHSPASFLVNTIETRDGRSVYATISMKF